MSDDLTYMPMTGWGVAGGAVEGTEAPIRQTLDDLETNAVLDYVEVPRNVLPETFVMRVVALTHHFAAQLRVSMPPLRYFAELTSEVRASFLERIAPDLRASYCFRQRQMRGFMCQGRVWINVTEQGIDLLETVAHETFHFAHHEEASHTEAQARDFGLEVRAQLRGG